MASATPRRLEDTAHLLDADHYERVGYPHETWRELRARRPIHFVEREQGESFWAITKHADITQISRQPELFSSSPCVVRDQETLDRPVDLPQTIISLDPPIHAQWRKLVSRRMTPNRIARFHDDIERIVVQIVRDLEQHEDAGCDFVEVVAAPLPIAVIAFLLGVPADDWRQIYQWTNQTAGHQDPENRRPGEHPTETMERAAAEQFQYFAELREERLKNPQDDLVTLLANATVDGKPLPVMEILAFYHILITAGNETTRNATSGGLLALIEHADQLAKLQAEPGLVKSGVEEMLRWTSPLIHFARSANRDTEIAGQPISAGDVVCMFYPSANRDEEVFDDPYAFRVDRRPNPHLSFGVGEHYCLGAHIARLELCVIFQHLLPRLAEVEVAGPISRLRSNIVGGIKRLPIRYRLKPPA